MEGALVWWVIGTLLIAVCIVQYRRGHRRYAVIGLILAVAALLTGVWTWDATDDGGQGQSREQTTSESATPDLEEGGV